MGRTSQHRAQVARNWTKQSMWVIVRAQSDLTSIPILDGGRQSRHIIIIILFRNTYIASCISRR